MTRYLIGPGILTVLSLVGILVWLGVEAFLLASLLIVLEVTLSFDNAVVNARVLRGMSDLWQRRFLTWGILVAVVGTRLVLPVLIVAVAVFASPYEVFMLAVTDPEAYGELLLGAKYMIGAFGGAFLLMVSLKYFFNQAKEVHWIETLERTFVSWGRIEAIEIALALLVLVGVYAFVGHASILVAGIVGILLFIVMEGVTHSLGDGAGHVARAGFSAFIYLNVLDAAFSLDGVVAAFAITTALPIIVVGLGLGAYMVRTLTVIMVKRKTLDTLKYLEHGAHWAIFGLAGAMLLNLVMHVPEIITGLIGLLFVGLSYYSSRKVKKA